jgi:hypothetical protein
MKTYLLTVFSVKCQNEYQVEVREDLVKYYEEDYNLIIKDKKEMV